MLAIVMLAETELFRVCTQTPINTLPFIYTQFNKSRKHAL